jgi:hypothetical protein
VAEDVRLDEGGDLVAELELVKNFLDIWRKTIEVGFEVGLQLLRPGSGS